MIEYEKLGDFHIFKRQSLQKWIHTARFHTFQNRQLDWKTNQWR